ncbi:MAG: fumarylacetoacetate hydrolase family protein [Pseudomonadota bacterium]
MKLCTFEESERARVGVVREDGVVDLSAAPESIRVSDMRVLLNKGKVVMEEVADWSRSVESSFEMSNIRLCAPILNPSKIMAIGLNYRDHVEESGLQPPSLALMFSKFPSAIVGPDDDIVWSDALTSKVDYEVELAVVIGAEVKNATQEEAMNAVAGYTICNDVTARDLQLEKGDQWLRGKCLDTFCPLGPWIVTSDEIPDPHALNLQTRVNGDLRQDSNTRHLIYDIPYLISYLSAAFTLYPGDIILTGTPAGVGAFSDPPVWLKHGDEITLSIDPIGTLSNSCRVSSVG